MKVSRGPPYRTLSCDTLSLPLEASVDHGCGSTVLVDVLQISYSLERGGYIPYYICSLVKFTIHGDYDLHS